jgi:hypothetical protein
MQAKSDKFFLFIQAPLPEKERDCIGLYGTAIFVHLDELHK